MKYDVTIGIPVYKSAAYIRQALESALAQTYTSIEFLIVDDGGNDGSLAIIQDIQQSHPRGADIRLLIHDTNLGVSASRNQMIEEARGEYLYFMDSDDTIAAGTIALLMSQIRQYDAEIAFGSYEKIELSGERTVYEYPLSHFSEPDQLAVFAYRQYGGIQASACNYLVKVSVLRDNNLRFVNTDFWEDMVFTYDLVTYISRAVLLPDITYTYCCREHSLSHYQKRAQIDKAEILRNVKAIDYLKTETPILYNKVYFPNRCYNIVMTDFYIACHVLKRRKTIVPAVSCAELKTMMSHPASFVQICGFRQSRMKNLALFFLSRLPAPLCVAVVWCIGKFKKLI